MKSKKSKLLFSLCSLMFCIGVMCFGVYASVKVEYQVSGIVHYEIDNAYVDIETRVYSANKLLDYASGGRIVNALRDENLSNLTSTASSNGLTLKSKHTQTSLGEEFNSSLSTSLQDITYSSTNGYAYFIVVNVKNKTSEIVSAIIEDDITSPDNSWCINTGYITGFDNTTTNNNFIFAFGLDDAGTEIESTQFNFVLDIDLGELQPTTTKYTINETAKTLRINSDATGVVVIGKGESTATNLTLSSQSKNISHVYCFDDCGITSLSTYAFNNCTQLTEMIIPSGIQTIQYGAIRNCNALTEIVIPNSVKSIDRDAFNGCTGLTEISIPAGIQSISEGAFQNFSGLEQITVEDGNTVYYSENNCIINTSTKKLILGCKNSVIPNGVKSIGDYAFYGCSGLTEIIIPNGVTSIGEAAFHGCSGLTEITIPSSVQQIYGPYSFMGSGGAFQNCSGLINVTIENGLKYIGTAAFYGCSGLTEIIIPDSVTSIGLRAFYGCSGLTEIIILDGVTSIRDYAFSGCSGLTEIIIPESVESIGESVFSSCTSLSEITILSSVTSIGNSAFSGCQFESVTYSTTDNSTYDFVNGTLTILGEVADNPAWYSANINPLITKVVFSEITSIGDFAFFVCTSLSEITIPSSVESIGNRAFYGCNNLNTVYIDSQNVVTSLKSSSSAGYLISNLKSGTGCVYINENITNNIPNNYLNSTNFDIATEAVNGYICYRKK